MKMELNYEDIGKQHLTHEHPMIRMLAKLKLAYPKLEFANNTASIMIDDDLSVALESDFNSFYFRASEKNLTLEVNERGLDYISSELFHKLGKYFSTYYYRTSLPDFNFIQRWFLWDKLQKAQDNSVPRIFAFNQPSYELTCGYRCLAAILKQPYEEFVEKYKILNPKKEGLFLVDIHRILYQYQIPFVPSFPTREGLYFILIQNSSKIFSYDYHYVLYRDGVLYDSLREEPLSLPLDDLREHIERHYIGNSLDSLLKAYRIQRFN